VKTSREKLLHRGEGDGKGEKARWASEVVKDDPGGGGVARKGNKKASKEKSCPPVLLKRI